jgi:hypothetical protein
MAAKFSYMTRSADDKSNVTVSFDFIADRVLNRGVEAVGRATDDSRFALNLSDGALVHVDVTTDGVEIVYFAPIRK